jgi:hypothetical protein
VIAEGVELGVLGEEVVPGVVGIVIPAAQNPLFLGRSIEKSPLCVKGKFAKRYANLEIRA